MLKNYLTFVPYTKVVIVEDSLQEKGKTLFEFILNTHLERLQQVHYFVFQETFKRVQSNFKNSEKIIFHDCVSNPKRWKENGESERFENLMGKLNGNDIVFIDSLAHVIHQYGLAETYRLVNSLRRQKCVQQIVALLHLDLLKEEMKADRSFEHISTLYIKMRPGFKSGHKRMEYVYQKLGGKIVKQIEEYYFHNGALVTQKVEKLDPKKLLERSVPLEVNPETLSTFRIGLSEKEKESRDQLVLPYLPKQDSGHSSQENGSIFYQLDEQDDWDEEDPDDDLDI